MLSSELEDNTSYVGQLLIVGIQCSIAKILGDIYSVALKIRFTGNTLW